MGTQTVEDYNERNKGIQKGFVGRLLGMYAQGDRVEKGEGDKGGKVIGHTKSGKPVYEHSKLTSQNFSLDDHRDAIDLHTKAAAEYNAKLKGFPSATRKDDDSREAIVEKRNHHKSMAEKHAVPSNFKKSEDDDLEKGLIHPHNTTHKYLRRESIGGGKYNYYYHDPSPENKDGKNGTKGMYVSNVKPADAKAFKLHNIVSAKFFSGSDYENEANDPQEAWRKEYMQKEGFKKIGKVNSDGERPFYEYHYDIDKLKETHPVGRIIRHDMAAPGIGSVKYRVVKVDDEGVHAHKLEDTSRILEPHETE